MGVVCKQGFLLGFLLMLACACNQDQTNYIVELCDVKERGDESLYLLSDGGETLYTSSSSDLLNYTAGQRSRVTYIKLEGKNASKDEVMIEVKYMLPVLIKDAISRESLKGVIKDPVWLINQPWYGGGYLNFEFSYGDNESSEIKHEIQLVRDSIAPNKIYMTFGHNANGDVSQKNVTALASFPLTSISGYQSADSLIVKVLEGSKYKIYRLPAIRN